MTLTTAPNLPDADAVYERLIAAHDGLDESESADFNARLVLILMNHVGDPDVIDAALALASKARGQGG